MAKNTHQSTEIEDEKKLKSCFIITPIGETNSDVFKKAMGLIDAVIEPVLKEHGYEATPANRISITGSISRKIIQKLLDDDLVIANLTGLNPNVMYELAVRHAVKKPVILMVQRGTVLPFDIKDQSTIYYDDDLSGVNKAKETLSTYVSAALSDPDISNPIYESITEDVILKKVTSNDDPLMIILERLNNIESKIQVNPTRYYREAAVKKQTDPSQLYVIATPKQKDKLVEFLKWGNYKIGYMKLNDDKESHITILISDEISSRDLVNFLVNNEIHYSPITT